MLDARNECTAPQGWGSLSPIGIAVHHTVTDLSPDATEAQERSHIRAIDRYHVSLNYGSFGYHCIVFKSGRVYQTGDPSRSLAHVKDRNHQLRGVTLVGDFTSTLPDAKQLAGLAEALTFLDGANLSIKGHNDWSVPGWGTECPGRIREVNFSELLKGHQEPIWVPSKSQVAHTLHFAYTGYYKNNREELVGTDKDVLGYLHSFYNHK